MRVAALVLIAQEPRGSSAREAARIGLASLGRRGARVKLAPLPHRAANHHLDDQVNRPWSEATMGSRSSREEKHSVQTTAARRLRSEPSVLRRLARP
jgi:hypothetical protein